MDSISSNLGYPRKKEPQRQQVNQAVLKHLHPEHVEGEIWALEYRAAPGSVAVRGAARRPLVGLPAWGIPSDGL